MALKYGFTVAVPSAAAPTAADGTAAAKPLAWKIYLPSLPLRLAGLELMT